MLNPFSRTELLLGRDAMERLASSRMADIYKTRVDPPARVMRRELSKRGIRHLKVVYSKEEALTPTGWEAEAAALGKRQIPGSSAFVPGTAGLILAGEVVRDIAMAAPEA